MTYGGWHPWQELRRRAHIELHFNEVADEMGGGLLGVQGDRAWIVLSPALGRRQRRAVLTHELIHEERGIDAGGCPREEAAVHAETARRLVPMVELAMFAAHRSELGPVMAWEVADHFDVPEWVAWEAVRQVGSRTLELGTVSPVSNSDSIARVSRER